MPGTPGTRSNDNPEWVDILQFFAWLNYIVGDLWKQENSKFKWFFNERNLIKLSHCASPPWMHLWYETLHPKWCHLWSPIYSFMLLLPEASIEKSIQFRSLVFSCALIPRFWVKPLHCAPLVFITQAKSSMDFFTFIIQRYTVQNRLKKIYAFGLQNLLL